MTPSLRGAVWTKITPQTGSSFHEKSHPNLAKLFVAHLIEIGVATRPPLTPAQAERAELLSNFETYLLRQRGLSPRSVYHVLRFADRFLDHRFGDHMLDLPAVNARDVGAFREHLLSRKRLFRDKTRPRICAASSSICSHRALGPRTWRSACPGRISLGAQGFVICRLARWRPFWPRYEPIRGVAPATTPCCC